MNPGPRKEPLYFQGFKQASRGPETPSFPFWRTRKAKRDLWVGKQQELRGVLSCHGRQVGSDGQGLDKRFPGVCGDGKLSLLGDGGSTGPTEQ